MHMFYRTSLAIFLAISSSSAFSQAPSLKTCSSAVKASTAYVNAAIELNKKQRDTNQISQSDFEHKQNELLDFKNRNTIEACMSGKDADVYACLSTSTGELKSCRN